MIVHIGVAIERIREDKVKELTDLLKEAEILS